MLVFIVVFNSNIHYQFNDRFAWQKKVREKRNKKTITFNTTFNCEKLI